MSIPQKPAIKQRTPEEAAATAKRAADRSHRELSSALRALLASRRGLRKKTSALQQQPFDDLLLERSRIYRKSRSLFLAQGGAFRPELLSSPRTLSSVSLLENWIPYSPIESELLWTHSLGVKENARARLAELRSFATSVFHEQSHRLLWRFLPPPPPGPAELIRKFLNFSEALVIITDMALGDELGSRARAFYLSGAIYDPGTAVRRELPSRRAYRNYLQAALHATYLVLELKHPERIEQAVAERFGAQLGIELALRAARRAARLDPLFVELTNPSWQRKHRAETARRLRAGRHGEPPLLLESDPLVFSTGYLWAERWFDRLGI